ncbi:MAG: aminotransferase class I/II-fold pyridoxal phosphate-dependent enzyme [Nitrospiraceae bacterium]|jgi:lysine decarboxylase|nr:aminotransferase class I/II-fold pyridoxal phosphate-dependent enzyme [Nitrospiraceae bacterium]
MDQSKTPLFDAMVSLAESRKVSFHTPGHKSGKGISTRFRKFVGPRVFSIDLTCLDEVDSLQKPRGVIKESQELAAEIYGADQSYFLVNGTSGGNQAMVVASLNPGEPVLVTRNVHKSVISGMIMTGCQPVFIPFRTEHGASFPLNYGTRDILDSIDRHSEIRTLYLTSPNYYGVTIDLVRVAEAAHAKGMRVLLDEAHGPHLHFHPELPSSGMAAGIDLAVQSTHKIIGGMTQASMLHARKERIDLDRLSTVLRYLQTTSPSYILMASLDLARMQMATEGVKLLGRALELARWARMKIREIPGLRCANRTEIQAMSGGENDLDETKLTIDVRGWGVSGYQVSQRLNLEFGIQVEMADIDHVLVIVSIGDHRGDLERLVNALVALSRENHRQASRSPVPSMVFFDNLLRMTPREAFFAQHETVPLEDSTGRIASDIVTVYPPGVPLLVPGEEITAPVIDTLCRFRDSGATMDGLDMTNRFIQVVKDHGSGK